MAISKVPLNLGSAFRQGLETKIKNEMSTDINTMSTNFGQRINAMDLENQTRIDNAIANLNATMGMTPTLVDNQSAIVDNGFYLIANENDVDYGNLYIKYNGANQYVGNLIDLPNTRLNELERKVDNHMHLISIVGNGVWVDSQGNTKITYSFITPITNMVAKSENGDSGVTITFNTY